MVWLSNHTSRIAMPFDWKVRWLGRLLPTSDSPAISVSVSRQAVAVATSTSSCRTSWWSGPDTSLVGIDFRAKATAGRIPRHRHQGHRARFGNPAAKAGVRAIRRSPAVVATPSKRHPRGRQIKPEPVRKNRQGLAGRADADRVKALTFHARMFILHCAIQEGRPTGRPPVCVLSACGQNAKMPSRSLSITAANWRPPASGSIFVQAQAWACWAWSGWWCRSRSHSSQPWYRSSTDRQQAAPHVWSRVPGSEMLCL